MTTFPFDPPYKLRIAAPEGNRWVEVRPDGSQVDTTPPPTTMPPASAAKPAAAKSSQAGALLNVPFAEKDEAKRLGASWDAARKKWYVPQGVDPAPFSRWTID